MFGEVGEKYIIEIGEEIDTEKGKLFRIKGFNSLVFDYNGLMRLEPHIEVTEEEVGEEEHYEGLMEAWVACKEILELSPAERNYLFGYEDPKYILRMYEPEEAIEIMKNRKEEGDQTDEIIAILKKRGIDIDKEELFSLYEILRKNRD